MVALSGIQNSLHRSPPIFQGGKYFPGVATQEGLIIRGSRAISRARVENTLHVIFHFQSRGRAFFRGRFYPQEVGRAARGRCLGASGKCMAGSWLSPWITRPYLDEQNSNAEFAETAEIPDDLLFVSASSAHSAFPSLLWLRPYGRGRSSCSNVSVLMRQCPALYG